MNKFLKRTILAGLICVLALPMFCMAEDLPEDVVLIINKEVPVKEIKLDLVKEVFLGKYTKWQDEDGSKVKVVLATLKDGEINDSFMKAYVKKTAPQFGNFWKKIVFSGKGKMPKSLKTEKEMIEYVAEEKGCVGYMSKAEYEKLSADIGDKVSVLKVIVPKE